jgi:hypothetical protein
MFHLLRSWLGQPARQKRPPRAFSRWHPEVESLEDRFVPSITFSGANNTGLATITGTSGADQFKIQLLPGLSSSPINIVLSDGTTQETATLSKVTGVVINGSGGKGSLTLDVGQNLLNGTNLTRLLPIQFNGGPGAAVLNLLGSTGSSAASGGGGTGTPAIAETFALGSNGSPNIFTLSNVGSSSTTDLIKITLPGFTSIVDSLSGTNFIFNGTADNNLIHLQDQSRGGTASLVIKGVNAQDDGTIPGRGNDNNSGQGAANFTASQTLTNANAFAPITLTGKTDVRVNGLGGDDLFVTNIKSLPAGMNLTLDGGSGTNVLAAHALPTAVNVVNFERQDRDANSIAIDSLYATMLNRPADDTGLTYYGVVLFVPFGGGGRSGVINDILHSEEARTNQLRTYFQHFLGRNLDDAARLYFLNLFDQGASEEQVMAAILGSQEFQQRAQSLGGGTSANANFINALSRVLLNRDADSNMQNYFGNLLQNTSASTVAQTILQSQEFRALATSQFFQTLLGRNLDDAARGFFTSLPPSTDLDQIFTMIAQSNEFFNRS